MSLDYSDLSLNEQRTYHLQRMDREDILAWLEDNPFDAARIGRAMAKRHGKGPPYSHEEIAKELLSAV